MPLMISESGDQQRVVPDRAVDAYQDRGWTTADGASADAGPPAHADRKADWVDYAVARGMARDEAEDATKAELVERFS